MKRASTNASGAPARHEAGAGPPAQDELQRVHDEGLARTGLARQRGHAWPEGERQVLYDAEIAHAQLRQHGVTTAPPHAAHRTTAGTPLATPVGQQAES